MDRVQLVGADDVRQAGYNIEGAAQVMRMAADSIEQSMWQDNETSLQTLRCNIAATLIAHRNDTYDGSMSHASWMAGVAAEALRFARIIIKVDNDMQHTDGQEE